MQTQSFNFNELNKMSVEELCKMNNTIVEIIKAKRKVQNAITQASLNVGDSVSYTGKFGLTKGKVTEMRRTKVVVQSIHGAYLVPASMLKKED